MEFTGITLALNINALRNILAASLPRCYVEPTAVLFVPPAISFFELGRLCAVRAVHVGDVLITGIPRFVRRGAKSTVCTVALNDSFLLGGPEEIASALAMLCTHLNIVVFLESPATPRERVLLPVTLFPRAGTTVINASVDIPLGVLGELEHTIILASISMAGENVPTSTLPAHFTVVSGSIAPCTVQLQRSVSTISPAVSSFGRMYVPSPGKFTLVFDNEGSPLSTINLESLSLRDSTNAAAICDATDMLFLGEGVGGTSQVVGVDAKSLQLRWVQQNSSDCYGLVAFSSQGIVIASTSNATKLIAYRMTDGKILGEALLAGGQPGRLAGDEVSGMIYASSDYSVWAFQWDSVTQTLVNLGNIAATGRLADVRPLAVLPPAPGKRDSHLVVGTRDTKDLLVLSIPGHAIVAKHTLDIPTVIKGLAGDPLGGVLVVCCESALHVLEWPLPGMPPLE